MPTRRRGGARRGAGRKPILTDLQRLKIGAAIDRRLWRKTRTDFVRSVDAKFADDDLRALWARLQATPDIDRRKVDPNALADLLADIEAEIEEGGLQGQRRFRGPIRVAPGIRKPIIRSVARAASRLYCASVSERTAERCLEEYRAINAKVTAELANYTPDIESGDTDEV
jgi:hypothetical protein